MLFTKLLLEKTLLEDKLMLAPQALSFMLFPVILLKDHSRVIPYSELPVMLFP